MVSPTTLFPIVSLTVSSANLKHYIQASILIDLESDSLSHGLIEALTLDLQFVGADGDGCEDIISVFVGVSHPGNVGGGVLESNFGTGDNCAARVFNGSG